MQQLFASTIQQMDANDAVHSVRAVTGGDINEAYYVRSLNREFFVKLNRSVDKAFFEFEKKGLERINQTDTIHVPDVYGIYTDEEKNIPMLWMEWITGEKSTLTDDWLGERLADMHLKEGKAFGLDEKSFIGKLEQDNQMMDNWAYYYRDYRLAGQLEIGMNHKTITGRRKEMLMALMENIDRWIPKNPLPSLLHGDLWGGNWMVGKKGNPYLIDPSVLYGDHEFEIAFTELFGGFSHRFYDAYTSVYPLSDTYEDKKPLYQLYYLLIHLNMFGESYGPSVDRILQRYAG
ncbi:fructosamine kinase family protein [Virgibacillus kimchii]